MTDKVTTNGADGVLVITINRPEVRNAIDRAVSEAVAAALDRMDKQEEFRVGILTGAGGNFSAGMDLKAFLAGEQVGLPGRGLLGLTERTRAKPLIAAVEGYALAGGFEAMLACDLVVASNVARFGLPEVKRGLAATAGGLLRLPRQIPYRVAMELALTGGLLDAARAERLGLVNMLTEPGAALHGALSLAATIAANAPLAVAAAKHVVTEQRDWPLPEMFARQAAIAGQVIDTEDAKEGARAFLERRAPIWRGR